MILTERQVGGGGIGRCGQIRQSDLSERQRLFATTLSVGYFYLLSIQLFPGFHLMHLADLSTRSHDLKILRHGYLGGPAMRVSSSTPV